MTLAIVDVAYDDAKRVGVAAGVLAQYFNSAPNECTTYHVRYDNPSEYTPGFFYERELDPLLTLLRTMPPHDGVIIDGYCWLGNDRFGLGRYLWRALGQDTPVVGIAKTKYEGAIATPILRGKSKTPLYASICMRADEGHIDNQPSVALSWAIRLMHGPYRIPSLCKLADSVARQELAKL